jgi:hypothetical protein
MDRRQVHVVIANFGGFGGLKEDAYAHTTGSLKPWLEEQEAVTVEIVESKEALLERLSNAPPVSVVVFRSRGTIGIARETRRRHGVRCVVLTGLMPTNEVTILEKDVSHEAIASVILRR